MDNSKTRFDVWVQSIKTEIEQAPRGFINRRCRTIIRAYGARNKTRKVDDQIVETLHACGIVTLPDFHACSNAEYVKLTLKESFPKLLRRELTDDEKQEVEQLAKKDLDSEMSVSIRFIVPLLELLGYTEEDRSDSYSIFIYEGATQKQKKADFVLFNGRKRANDNSLLLVEAKAVGVDLKNAVGQARSYTMWVGAPYYLVTNGDEIRLFHFRDVCQVDQEVYYGKRKELNEETFNTIYSYISKDAIIELKPKSKE